jgi:hypothetical protein
MCRALARGDTFVIGGVTYSAVNSGEPDDSGLMVRIPLQL